MTKRRSLMYLAVLAFAMACGDGVSSSSAHAAPPAAPPSQKPAPEATPAHGGTAAAPAPAAGQAVAVFAGGCFWCMETPFESIEGIVSVTSGYTGGGVEHPSYEQVSAGGTGHFESVRVVYDPARVSYPKLLEVFLHNVDPTQADGQFCDHGSQYRSAIFVHDDAQRTQAAAALERAHAKLGRAIATQILPETTFYVAEAYHQDFYKTHPARYHEYRSGCGRDARLRELWGEAAGH